ncbi:LytR/AlgR family response regulator transcription factor [Pseudoalteromonas denitrificans]|jgi:hypothetical protein|uniref:Transcriptional regulator, LytTR family n=1 Tax=Pseudoalteromonas denitrificans DSM 6059 TaxID=1123010 RepID=A0A1I1I9L2_9GAMM|nr:LytTR family DNA-binding domain-containing protein [Pseudoalteromonas denitrificans]SFC32442.1 transcriptional regulator, LytTR family [Pseudoalteromonas denitrificans DSM 6059]
MNKLKHFQQYKLCYEITFICLYFLINNTLLATSVVMEAKRQGPQLPFQLWEPFVWEYSSALSTIFLFPFIVFLLKKCPFNWQQIKRSIFIYFLASVAFSLMHVGVMVSLREAVYFFMAGDYSFGDLWFELLYEFRKDLWSFIFFIAVIKVYDFIIVQLQGEANPVANGENEPVTPNVERLLVKKLGKEFIIKIEDIQWLESSGNYVNLHINERIYPMRATLTGLIDQLTQKGFCRIHRSHAIKLDMIESITPLSSGDSEVKLTTGKVLMLSRRYKDSFKASLS